MDQQLINRQLQQELKLEAWQVDNVVNLIDEGNTIPFIARYRKEMHGTLSDEVLRNLNERLAYLRTLADTGAQKADRARGYHGRGRRPLPSL